MKIRRHFKVLKNSLFTINVPLPPIARPVLAEWYSLSYLYFSPVGTITAISVGLIVSVLTGK